MSEDISAMIRVGVTIMIVAMVVAVVINLVIVGQSTISSGSSTLQAGVNQMSNQEFEMYNQKKLSGSEVKSAIALYQGRDIAIVVRTNACIKGLSGAPKAYNYGAVIDGASEQAETTGAKFYILNTELTRVTGDTFYTANLKYDDTGLLLSCTNTKGTTSSSSPQYILPSARFLSELIKNDMGAIVGISFTQMQ